MQGIFPLKEWYSEQPGTKMAQKPVLEGIPTVELNKLKRKHVSSPEPYVHQIPPPKKLRPMDVVPAIQTQDMTHTSAKAAHQQTTAVRQFMAAAIQGNSSTNTAHILDSATTNIAGSSISNTKAASAAPQPSRTSMSQQTGQDVAMPDAQSPTPNSATKLDQLRQTIEYQINMEILLKHEELRLIEQEEAKCQIALEQLRRCELRPFPGAQGFAESLTAGTGAAILPQAGFTKAAHPAPYGVVDGPYSRHYRKWLLQDPDFDSEPVNMMTPTDASLNAASRPTRNSGYARKSVGKTIPTSGKYADHMHCIPNYPAALPKKDKSAPLVLRRSTDNKLVKLVCKNCNRSDMNSIQGFLNHCRIAHKVDYKSHDQAAVDCGRPLDEQEIASLPAESQSAPAPRPAPRPTPNRAPVAQMVAAPNGAVHPLNSYHGAPLLTPISQPSSTKAAIPARPVAYSPFGSSPLKPSSQMPRLSALFAKNNIGGDLEQAVASAKHRDSLDLDDGLPSPDQSSPNSPAVANPFAQAVSRGMPVTTGSVERPPSRKGHRHLTITGQRPRPSPLMASSSMQPVKTEQGEVPESPQFAPSVVSPHTADSNPGLVSDDDDNGSASEEESGAPESHPPTHPLNVPRHCSDNMDLDVTVEDGTDEHGVVIRRNSMLAAMRASGSDSRK